MRRELRFFKAVAVNISGHLQNQVVSLSLLVYSVTQNGPEVMLVTDHDQNQDLDKNDKEINAKEVKIVKEVKRSVTFCLGQSFDLDADIRFHGSQKLG